MVWVLPATAAGAVRTVAGAAVALAAGEPLAAASVMPPPAASAVRAMPAMMIFGCRMVFSAGVGWALTTNTDSRASVVHRAGGLFRRARAGRREARRPVRPAAGTRRSPACGRIGWRAGATGWWLRRPDARPAGAGWPVGACNAGRGWRRPWPGRIARPGHGQPGWLDSGTCRGAGPGRAGALAGPARRVRGGSRA